MPRSEAAPRSIGACAPRRGRRPAGSRNSSLVATRSCARVRTRSGSSTRTWLSGGSSSTSSSISSTSAGASDSMPSTAMPSASLSVISRSCGCALPSSAARRRTSSVSSSSRHGGAHRRVHRLQGALVGDREGADLVDLVAEELHAQRVLLGGREHVHDASPDSELTALLHEVDPGVRRSGELGDEDLELHLLAAGELDRLEVGQALDLGLQDRADRRDDHLQRPVAPRGRPGARAGAAPPAGGRRCRCVGSAARAAASPRPGRALPSPGRAGRAAPRSGPRPRARSRPPPARSGRRRPDP